LSSALLTAILICKHFNLVQQQKYLCFCVRNAGRALQNTNRLEDAMIQLYPRFRMMNKVCGNKYVNISEHFATCMSFVFYMKCQNVFLGV